MNPRILSGALALSTLFCAALSTRNWLMTKGHIIEVNDKTGKPVDLVVGPDHKISSMKPAAFDAWTVLTPVEHPTQEQLQAWPKMAEEGRNDFLVFFQENQSYFKDFKSTENGIRKAGIENLTKMAEAAQTDFIKLEQHTQFIYDHLGNDGIAIADEKRERLAQILTGLQHAADYKATLAELDKKNATPELAR